MCGCVRGCVCMGVGVGVGVCVCVGGCGCAFVREREIIKEQYFFPGFSNGHEN